MDVEKKIVTNGVGHSADDVVRRRSPMTNGYHEKVVNGTASGSTLREINVDELRERMQEIREDVLARVNEGIDDMVSEVLQRLNVAKTEKTKELFDNCDYKYRDKRDSSIKGGLPDKEFLERNSLLTDLFEVTHIRTIYNIFMVILILLFINTAVFDIMDSGSTNVGITTITKGFGKISMVFEIWCTMMVATCGIYVAFNVWARRRSDFFPNGLARKSWDYGWLTALIVYQIAFIVFPTREVLRQDLPIASSLIILMEQVRILMKTHAFVRSVAPRFLSYKPHAEAPKPQGPGFSQFLYFMFAPTLIYRDSYPRTKKIRWNVVVWSYTEVVMVVFYVAFIFERFLMPYFRQFGTHPMELRPLVLSIFGTMMPGILFFLCGFYCLLHSWMNGSAELLRFADRLFYKDWWNSTSYKTYYRTWNVVVHDWLYTYIYKDIYEIVAPGNKLLSTCAVFSVSAIFHEYILAFAFRFFYPVMLIMFGGLGLMLVFFTRRTGGNVFMWLTLCCGTGIMLSLYSMEFYARRNCAPYYDGILDLFLPRSWLCYKHVRA